MGEIMLLLWQITDFYAAERSKPTPETSAQVWPAFWLRHTTYAYYLLRKF